jgi:3-oxoacyl-(acyl-carrier-protein) synthase
VTARRRVVVTGLGVVSAVGATTETFWQALLAGTVGTRTLTRFDTTGLASSRGGEIPVTADGGRDTPSVRWARDVTRMALADARLTGDDGLAGAEATRTGVVFGTVLGPRPGVEEWVRRGAGGSLDPDGAGWLDATPLARRPAAELGLRGPNLTITTACAAGNSSIAFGADAIRSGRADVIVAGGADEISHAMLLMFTSLRALAPEVVQPFDLNRKGMMLGEGAAALVLEDEAHARGRRARIYGEVLGYGNRADAYHMTAPHPAAVGAVRSMTEALRAAGLAPEDVDYVSAHGTGTPSNDPVEALAIRTVFGSGADELPVSSIKSMLGHMQGAAASAEAVTCLLAMRDDLVPPNVNYETPDPACDIDVVANRPRQKRVRAALSNAFGFGGNIECVVFGRT